MIEMKLVTYPNDILRRKCEPVPVTAKENGQDVTFEESLSGLLKFMRELMNTTQAVGLAANQCNVPRRVFLMRRFSEGRPGEFIPTGDVSVVVNPVIRERGSSLIKFIEGCLSFPGRSVRTRRPDNVVVGYYDENGTYRQEHLFGFESIIFQHEFDHLQGKDMRDREYNGR